MFAIIRIRGSIKVNEKIEHTLELLRLKKVNHCVIYEETDKIKGMLNKTRNMITYGELDKETFKKMLLKRGKVYDKTGKLLKFKDVYADKVDQIATEILEGKKKLIDYGIKPVFRLAPPSKGFERKGIKKSFKEGGVLGYRGSDINILLKKMM